MTITKYWMIETNEFDDVLVEVIIPDPFASTEEPTELSVAQIKEFTQLREALDA
jgi:hypothetical protein